MKFFTEFAKLIRSKRFISLLVTSVLGLAGLAAVVMPVFGLDAPGELPAPEDLEARFIAAAEKLAAVITGLVWLWGVFTGQSKLIEAYTVRDPGTDGPGVRMAMDLDEMIDAAVARRLSGGYVQARMSKAEREDD
jgi:hypothetical protein